ncbi:hypothetical protein BDP27DRAFT_1230402, partial [Rhodocollybia butyracea]
ILSITCDNASANTAMLDELVKLLPDFQGRDAHVQCFGHTTNLTARGVLRPFEPSKLKTTEEGSEPAVPNDDGLEELYAELQDIKENGNKDKDDVEGFVEVLNEMTEQEREQWHENVKPVKTALYKVSAVKAPHGFLTPTTTSYRYRPAKFHSRLSTQQPCSCLSGESK